MLSGSSGIVHNKTIPLNKFRLNFQSKKKFGLNNNLVLGNSYQTKYQNQVYNSFEDEQKDVKDIHKLPPKWLDIYEETKDDLNKIKEISITINQKSSQRIKEFFGNEDVRLDLEIQKLLDDAMMKIKTCEQNMDIIVKEEEDSDDDYKIKLNMQKSLAIQIQEITQELRVQQKSLLEKLSKFQKSKKNAYDFENEDRFDKFAKNNTKLQTFENKISVESYELEHIESIALDRNEKIQHLVKSITQLNELFKQMNRLVIEQGTLLDRIDFNIDLTYQRTTKAKQELIIARDTQKSTRANNCIAILAVLNIIFIIVIVLKLTVFD